MRSTLFFLAGSDARRPRSVSASFMPTEMTLLPGVLFILTTFGGCGHLATPVHNNGADFLTSDSTSYFVEQGASDEALANVRRLDQTNRGTNGQLPQLTPAEHMRRAGIYLSNRAFTDARRHWQTLIARYPNDSSVSAALFWTGRSYFQERKYTEALGVFQQLGERETQSKEGRDGFYYVAPTLLRLNRPLEAAARYREYIDRFPQGERIEDAYLNTIDSLREGGNIAEAITWIARTREKFTDKPTAINALFARLRLDIATGDDKQAVATSDELLRMGSFGRGISTSAAEVNYLRALSLERSTRMSEAAASYQSVSDSNNSYYGRLATMRLNALAKTLKRDAMLAATVKQRMARARQETAAAASQYPIPFRGALVRYASARGVDPRLVLAIMRQESSFNPRAKSPAAARGLMQLTFDAATKYAASTPLKNLQEDDLYRPEISIQLACEYLAELNTMFSDLPEAVIASYNGGEDNVARWLKRAGQSDAGVFASEVGFAETKDYVFKVMANYRAYQQLYTKDLRTVSPSAASSASVASRR